MQQKWHKAINVAVALVLAVMLFPLFQPASQVVYASDYDVTYDFDPETGAGDGWTWTGPQGSDLRAENTQGYWCWTNDGTPSSNVGPLNGQGGSAEGCVYTEASGQSATCSWTMELTTGVDGSTYSLNLDYYLSVDNDDETLMSIDVDAWDGGSWNNLYSRSGGTDWTWENHNHDLSTYTNNDVKIRFVITVTGGTEWHNDIGIDTVRIYGDFKGPTLDQNHYWWRNDSYGLNENDGWYTTEDTAYVDLVKQTTVRLRAEIANTAGTAATDYQYRIEYSTSTGGPWTAVPVTATTEPFEMVDSGQYADEADITSGFLTATGIWANGKGVEDPSNKTGNFSLTNGYYTEFEYAIQATTNATTGGTYYFRLTNNGSITYFTYTRYPEVTIYSPPDVDQIHYRWRNDDGGEAAAWYNTDWGYRKTITFTSDTGKIPSTQSNFPVLIDVTDPDLRTTGNGGHVEHASGWDIVFTDSDGTILLDHEITQYTSSGSTATYTTWVRVPSLSTGKVIYMYYGNSSVSADPSTTDTWNSNFKLVQHLNETTGTHDDSTSNTNDGTPQGGVTQDATGKINGGDEFDGIDNYIDCGTGVSLNITSTITLEAWVKKATPVKRDIAEYEPMDAVLIRYPFGLPYALIADMADDVEIVTIVASSAQATTVAGLYSSNGVGCENGCTYLIAPTDSHWTRDYGPMFLWDENDELSIADFTYNRPRYDDNDIPGAYGTWQGIPVNLMDLEHTGGNWMSDGRGIAITTTLIEDENSGKTEAEIDQEAEDYYGITTWYKIYDAIQTGIHHIDCWAKLLAPDKVMVVEVAPSHSQYDELEAAVDWFENTAISCYGGNYTVYRVGDGPYINCLILKDKVYLPFTGTTADDNAAKSAFETAMPGYIVRGYTALAGEGWLDDDALHCRTHEIAQSTPWDYDFIVSKGKDAYNLQMNRVGSSAYGYTSNNEINTSTSTPTDWHHYVLTFEGGNQKLYIDGVLQDTQSPGGTIGSNSTEVTIGGSVPSGNFSSTLDDEGYFSGTLDEVRISATPRTADWVKTSYYSQNDPSANNFYTAGSETSVGGATWKAAQDTVVTGQARVENVRVRFSIKNTGGTASDYNYRLQVSETGPTSGFSDVPNTTGCGCDVAAMYTSTQFTNQDPTTNQLSADSLTWTAGKMVEDPSNQTDAITLNKDYFTEVEFNFRFTSNAASETIYWFRVANGTTVSYTEVAQITIETIPLWDSYEGDYGDSGGTQCDAFLAYATQHEVYMYGTGFSTGNYKVVYWDEAGSEIEVDSNIAVAGDGKLYSICVLEKGKATEGDWHVTAYYPSSYEPAAYSTVDSYIVADDTSHPTACGYAFYVDQGAIPEFPTVIAAISVAGLCFGIYYWMRKRRLAHVKA